MAAMLATAECPGEGTSVDPVSAIAGAIIAGATVALKDTATQAVKDAYQGLRTIAIDLYKLTSIAIVEKNPTSPIYKQTLEQEIRDTPGILDNSEVLRQVKSLTEALQAEPKEHLAAWGLVAENIRAAESVVLERISGTGGGAQVGSITSEHGGVRISDLQGGSDAKK